MTKSFNSGGKKMPSRSNKSATKLDKSIGEKIRTHRLKTNMTQEELGRRLRVTFQQIQKYERGINRVGSGRLYEIAEILELPVTSFFEADTKSKNVRASSPFDLIADPMAMQMVREFSKIGDVKMRRAIMALLEQMIETKRL
jgi:transcriptional regulator with XRE-family HTH domain